MHSNPLHTVLDVETPVAGSLAPQRRSMFSAEPTYEFATKGFSVRNFGPQHAYPPKELQPGLEELIIFTENSKRVAVPNGSVWVYAGKGYEPRILKDDIGCGMAFFVIEAVDVNAGVANELVSYIYNNAIRIGRGNHFINIAGRHPLAPASNLLAVHSSFNPGQVIPLTYAAAVRHQEDVAKRRREMGERLLAGTGIKGEFYIDYPHNTVSQEDGKTIYGKGAIRVPKEGGVGVLALNPFDGFYFYSANWKNYHGFMQHGTGKKCNGAMQAQPVVKKGSVQAYMFAQAPDGLYDEFNTINPFIDKFMFEHAPAGYASNKLVIRTG